MIYFQPLRLFVPTQLTIYIMLFQERKISKDVFVKHMRGLVEDHILKLAVAKLQEQVTNVIHLLHIWCPIFLFVTQFSPSSYNKIRILLNKEKEKK